MQQLPTTKSISSLGVLPLKLFTFKGLKVHSLPWIFSGSMRVRSSMIMFHESEEVASHKVAKKKYSVYIGVSRPARGWPKKNPSEPTALLCSESGSELLPPWPWCVSQIIFVTLLPRRLLLPAWKPLQPFGELFQSLPTSASPAALGDPHVSLYSTAFHQGQPANSSGATHPHAGMGQEGVGRF